MDKRTETIYEEHVSSLRTQACFLLLTLSFLILFIWGFNIDRLDILGAVFLFFFLFFLFYSVNYRTLIIQITGKSLKLKFGIFQWNVPLENIQECHLDELTKIQKYGGAGIHFLFVRKRYRASFNFLEYPRVVIELKRKARNVQDISFSTRQPEEVIQLLNNAQNR